jgi:hypothetical protein
VALCARNRTDKIVGATERAHLAGKQLVAFFRLFATGHIQKSGKHLSFMQGSIIITEAAGRYSSDFLSNHYAEVNWVSSNDAARGRESGRRVSSLRV